MKRPRSIGSDVHDVRRCARCGGDHDALVFQPFQQQERAPEFRAGDAVIRYQRWALCPITGDPILHSLSLLPERRPHGA